jgi:hypothetical protein
MPRATGLACAFIDAEGHLADAMADMEAAMVARFDRLAFRIDGATHPRTIEAAMRLAARVQVAERDIEMAGAYRRGAVSDARATGSDVILTGDLDHILRWLRAAPDEVDGALARVRAGEVDCLAVGRPAGAFERAPAPLRETERLVNLAFARVAGLTGTPWDLLSSVRVLSAPAADVIVGSGKVDTLGTDVEWPLLCRATGGLVVDYLEAAHLSYEEGNALVPEPADPAAPGSAQAWVLRLRVCGWMADAMAPYVPAR